MAINVIKNFKPIILLILALCALFPTNIQGTSSLSEKFNKCESKYWYKNIQQFKRSSLSKCLNNHKNRRHHNPHHTCNKDAILKKWENFVNCRCNAALSESNKNNNNDISVCYQISRFNKNTGKFDGEVLVYYKKKKSLNVVVKLPKNEDKNDFYNLNDPYQTIRNDQFLIKKYRVSGEVPTKISPQEASPKKFLLIDNGKVKESDTTIIPLSNVILDDNQQVPLNNIENGDNPTPPIKGPAKEQIKGPPAKDPEKGPEKGPAKGPAKEPAKEPAKGPAKKQPDQKPIKQPPAKSPQPPDQPPPDQPPNQPSPADQPPTINNDPGNAPKNSSPENKPTNTVSPQEINNENSKPSEQPRLLGLGIFGAIVAVGAAFVGFNTYERIKWRRHYRRGQAASQLENVPNYNGSSNYGRAY